MLPASRAIEVIDQSVLLMYCVFLARRKDRYLSLPASRKMLRGLKIRQFAPP